MTRSLLLFLLAFAVAACTKDEAVAPTPDNRPSPAATAPAAPVPAGEPEQALVTAVTSLKREPNDAAKVDAADGKKVSNWVATLYRGEQVTVLKVQDDWAAIKASDESTGWMKKTDLLPNEGTSLATVFETVKTFNRPDLLALNAARTIESGTLLFVVKTKDQFSEVNFQGKATAWVLSEKLNMDVNEIAAAKLVNKIRWLKAKKDPAADQFLELARSQFGGSRLVTMFDEAAKAGTEPGEAAAPEGAGTAPAGGAN
ncbi:MAG: SH3 domain-containing protein [Deltaproteobacteria bacterium]|nr:SH3 domain-containing protein [Deltaproteobacteria bacterium]